MSGSKQRRRITKTTSTGDSWKKRRRRERLLAEIGFTEHTPHTHTLTPTDGDSARRLMACRIRAITSGARRETGLEESSLKASSVCHLRSDRFQTDVRISSSIPTATYYVRPPTWRTMSRLTRSFFPTKCSGTTGKNTCTKSSAVRLGVLHRSLAVKKAVPHGCFIGFEPVLDNIYSGRRETVLHWVFVL